MADTQKIENGYDAEVVATASALPEAGPSGGIPPTRAVVNGYDAKVVTDVGGGGITDNTTEPNIPYKLGSAFENSNISQDPDGKVRFSTEILAEQGINTTPTSVGVGDALRIEGAGGQQINRSSVTGVRYQVPYQEIDKTGTNPAFQVNAEAEVVDDIRQPIFDTVMTSPLTFTYTAPRNEIVNKVYLRTDGDVTNFRYQVTSNATGEVVDSFPDIFRFEKGEGVNFTGAGVQEIDLYYVDNSSPNRYLNGEDYSITMEWDTGNFLGNVSNVPYYSYDYQAFEFVDIVNVNDDSTASFQFVIDEDDMSSNLDTKVPTQQSVKKYVDDKVASNIVYKGGYDAATNTPNLDVPPTNVQLGWLYVVEVAGTFFTHEVQVGDALIAEVTDPQTEADWTILERNLDAATIKVLYESNPDTNAFTDAEQTNLGNQSGTNTGDQDLSGLALKSNVLELDNTDAFTPDADYEPATKKYVDDNAGGDVKVYYAESLIESSTSSAWVNKVTLNLPAGFVAGDYFIEVYYGWRMNGTSEKFQSRVQLAAADLGIYNHLQEPQDSNNRHVAFRRFKRTMSAGAQTIELDFGDNNGGTAYIWDASITVTKIEVQ